MPNSEIKARLLQLKELLKIEKEADLEQYLQKIKDTSLAEQRKEGICWYPVQAEDADFDSGERIMLKITRNEHHTERHLFSSGSLVRLFSNSGTHNEQTHFAEAIVNRARRDDMIISLNDSKIPEWIKDGKLGVQLLFDENSYKEMDKALNFLLNKADKKLERLMQILPADGKAQFTKKYHINFPDLNESQNEALNLIDSAEDIAIIHGPPGTGKTTTIIKAITHILKKEKQILVCAPSNAAVDLLCEKLNHIGINALRIGHPARVSQANSDATTDARIAKHENFQELKRLKRLAEDARKSAGKYKRNFGQEERRQRRELYAEAKALRQEAKQVENYIIESVLSEAQVICATLVGANHPTLYQSEFKTVFIDEAAQALEPATWIPIIKSRRVIFAGDHHQLPPTVKSQKAEKGGLSITLFEKAIRHNPDADVMLKEQYRMNKLIMNWSNQYFYKSELIANEKVVNHLIFDGDLAFEFIDTAGCGFYDETDSKTLSTFNLEEADILFKHFNAYFAEAEQAGQVENIRNIAIISPYKAQVTRLQELAEQMLNVSENIRKKISINTVDSFQGQERDVIYISLVRSNNEGDIGFLSDIRRMNVATTRARKKLVIIGDSATISRHPFYDGLLGYVNEIGAYRSAFEFMY